MQIEKLMGLITDEERQVVGTSKFISSFLFYLVELELKVNMLETKLHKIEAENYSLMTRITSGKPIETRVNIEEIVEAVVTARQRKRKPKETQEGSAINGTVQVS